MGMVSASQIRAKLSAFLEDKIDLDSFEDWLVQKTWNIHQSGSVASESLTFAIEESLAEYSSDHLTERQLRNELREVLNAENITAEIIDVANQLVVKSSSSPAILLPLVA